MLSATRASSGRRLESLPIEINFQAAGDIMMRHDRPLTVRDAMRASSASVASVKETTTTRHILMALDRADVDELPIVADDGSFRGIIVRRDVERRLYDRGEELATAAMISEQPV